MFQSEYLHCINSHMMHNDKCNGHIDKANSRDIKKAERKRAKSSTETHQEYQSINTRTERQKELENLHSQSKLCGVRVQ